MGDKRDLLRVLGHDARTPLNAILGYSSLLRDGVVGTLTADQQGMLDRVLAAGRNLNELIGDLVFLAQTAAGGVPVSPREVPVVEVITAAVEALRDRPEAVAFEVGVDPAAETLTVDERLLRRILFHLLGNAFRHTRAGTVRVGVAPAPAGAALLAVTDSGAGIAPDRLTALRDALGQPDVAAAEGEVLGVGLVMVQRSVRTLGGELILEATEGQGCEVRVVLPGVLIRP